MDITGLAMTFVRMAKGDKMSNYTETAVANVSKEYVDNQKEDSGFVEFIVKQLSSELAERIMGILEREEEIIVGQTNLRVSEFTPTNSVEYRRQIHWDSLVRCWDCKYFRDNVRQDGYLSFGLDEFECKRWGRSCYPTDFCSYGERREDGNESKSV